MAKIKSKTLSFDPSPSTDVAGYKLYLSDAPLDYDSPSYDLGTQTSGIDLHSYAGDVDGNFNIGVSAVDDAGNESDIYVVAENYPLDFLAPLPPQAGMIV